MRDLFLGAGIAHSILVFAVVIAIGLYLGKFKLKGISIGSTWILFVAILLSHFGLRVDTTVLSFMKDFGLILFVFSIGLQVGPGFFHSFKKGGLQLNLLAVALVLLAVAVTVAIHFITGEDLKTMVGVMSGAVTNTPGLGAAQQTMADSMRAENYLASDIASATSGLASAYAVAYPLGVLLVIALIMFFKAIFKVDLNKEKEALDSEDSNEDVARRMHCEVENPAVFGLSIKNATRDLGNSIVISRILRDGVSIIASKVFSGNRLLVSKIADAQFSVVDSEADALLLENNLIKQYKPRYNILLKDSKTYPWIVITNDDFPKVYLTRRVDRRNGTYFGPYSSVSHANYLLEFFRKNYPLRSCNLKITGEAILRGKFRPCLDFHIGRCKGCCVGAVSKEEYSSYVTEITRLLKGGVNEIIREYEAEMKRAAAELRFEEAQVCKNRIESLKKHYSHSIISSVADTSCDVFSLVFDGQEAFGNFLRVRGGSVIQSLNLGFKMNIEEEQASVLSTFIAEIESKFGALAKEVIVPFKPDVEIDGIDFRIPARGDKLSLLELSVKNAKEYLFNSIKQREHTDPDEYRRMVLEDLRKALGMKELPTHIECFDNSNIQGTNPVASCVVFRDGVPSKKDYRKFKIKTVIGANDFASMKEVVNRRYSRMLVEAPDDLPQLVVIDGGEGQLEFARQALAELGLMDRLMVIGLAKRMELVIRVNDPYPLFLDRNSQALKVLMHIRDEAHRFGITFHRSLRSKAQIQSALREIKGVGEQTEKRLLMHYGSVARIAAAPLEDLSKLVSPALAAEILKALDQS